VFLIALIIFKIFSLSIYELTALDVLRIKAGIFELDLFLNVSKNALINKVKYRHWFSLIEGRKLYWVGVREKRSQYKLRRK
jgi:hypothetical protein